MYEVFAKTRSVCPVCLGTIDAEKAVAGDGFVHLIKIPRLGRRGRLSRA